MITPSRHRVSAINNYCRSLCSISFVLVKGVNKEYPLYLHMCIEPYNKIEESLPGGLSRDFFDTPEEAQKNVSWKLVSEFALETGTDDLYLLMGMYKEFGESPDDCIKCKDKIVQSHYEHHPVHFENAQHFLECRNQKAICQQAVDGVIAFKRVQTTQFSREQLLTERFKKLFHRMENLFSARSKVSIKLYMALKASGLLYTRKKMGRHLVWQTFKLLLGVINLAKSNVEQIQELLSIFRAIKSEMRDNTPPREMVPIITCMLMCFSEQLRSRVKGLKDMLKPKCRPTVRKIFFSSPPQWEDCPDSLSLAYCADPTLRANPALAARPDIDSNQWADRPDGADGSTGEECFVFDCQGLRKELSVAKQLGAVKEEASSQVYVFV
uniref:DNA 3'-5' helicase n=1 Tax=Rousettus bat polyomavirus TaxID=3141932 RepID=A0AAU7E2H1_9POLY